MPNPNVKPIPPKCSSVNEAAAYLNVVPLTVRRLIKAKKLRASHVGRRLRITPAAIERFLADNEVAS
jgi:excisionase family DNA binding protein